MTESKKEEMLPETLIDEDIGTKMKDQKDNLAIFIDNIIGFCRIEYAKVITSEDIS